MRTDNIVRVEAMNALITALGAVDAERFISMVKRDTFDYTEWQQKLWDGLSIEEITQWGLNLKVQVRKPQKHTTAKRKFYTAFRGVAMLCMSIA